MKLLSERWIRDWIVAGFYTEDKLANTSEFVNDLHPGKNIIVANDQSITKFVRNEQTYVRSILNELNVV